MVDGLAGMCAGMTSTFVSHPLDTIKIRYQTNRENKLTLVRCVRDIYRFEGVSLITTSQLIELTH